MQVSAVVEVVEESQNLETWIFMGFHRCIYIPAKINTCCVFLNLAVPNRN